MMGGVLRSAQDKREGAPEKPTFMDRVPKEQWTEEQQRAVKDYEAREKLYHEEREKKVKARALPAAPCSRPPRPCTPFLHARRGRRRACSLSRRQSFQRRHWMTCHC